MTGQLYIREVNQKNEQTKNEDLRVQIAYLQAELVEERKLVAQERANTSQIQSQFMQLMTSINNKSDEQVELLNKN